MTHPHGASIAVALPVRPVGLNGLVKLALLSSLAWLASAVDAIAADCSTGRCPSSSEQANCALPTSKLADRQAVDPGVPAVLNFEKWYLDAAENINFTDGVELRQGERVLRAQEIHRDGESGNWIIPGIVELADPNLIVRGKGAEAAPAAGTVDIEATSFELPARFGHGSASRIRLSQSGEVNLRDVRYTTCPGPKPDWELKASELDIDAQAHEGSARNAWVNFKGVPIFYWPYMSFPVGDERKSGLLFPNFGNSSNSGWQISTPWYWNIAPNYDATLIPTWYALRGYDLGAEFRFLTHMTHGVAQVNYLPNDQQTGKDRSYIDLHAQTDFTSQLRLYTDGSNVSDTAWLDDFGNGAQRAGVTVLQRAARLMYRSDEWSIAALAQNYQTVDPDSALSSRPYTLLPQLSFLGWFPNRFYGLGFGIASEYSNFRHNTNSTALDGQRFDATPEVRLPLRRNGIFVEPAIAWRYTAYRLDPAAIGSSDRTPTRSAPSMSVDSGVIFERLSGKAEQRIQTLEPRLLYLYVPYRAQDNLPVFDTKLPDFNLIQLFSPNRYVGPDRLGDANQIAMGLTTRLLDSHSGQQFMSATVGEVYRFATPRVSLPGEAPNTASSSDVIGELKLGDYKDWNAGLGLQWDPNLHVFQRSEVNLQYIPGAGRVVNAGYIYRKAGLAQLPGLKQIDTSAAWPVGNRVSLYARYVYSLLERKQIDGFIGVQYRDCCWGFRFVAGRSVSLTGQLETHIQWQVELNGLANVGTANDAFLSQSIRGYSAARLDRSSVP